MVGKGPLAPPRNGEVARRSRDGGAGAERVRPRDPSTTACGGGPPPRSGEERRRRKHRTLGAPDVTIASARKLRKDMSPPERLLWSELRKRPGGYRFRRQHPFGRFVLDFCCIEGRLCVEVDGDAHDFEERAERDVGRDEELAAAGYRTLRLPATYVFRNLEGAVMALVEECRAFAPPRNGEVAARSADGGAGASKARCDGGPVAAPPPLASRAIPLPVPGRSRA
jgi:very-short-patch-repair endonuclease